MRVRVCFSTTCNPSRHFCVHFFHRSFTRKRKPLKYFSEAEALNKGSFDHGELLLYSVGISLGTMFTLTSILDLVIKYPLVKKEFASSTPRPSA